MAVVQLSKPLEVDGEGPMTLRLLGSSVSVCECLPGDHLKRGRIPKSQKHSRAAVKKVTRNETIQDHLSVWLLHCTTHLAKARQGGRFTPSDRLRGNLLEGTLSGVDG